MTQKLTEQHSREIKAAGLIRCTKPLPGSCNGCLKHSNSGKRWWLYHNDVEIELYCGYCALAWARERA